MGNLQWKGLFLAESLKDLDFGSTPSILDIFGGSSGESEPDGLTCRPEALVGKASSRMIELRKTCFFPQNFSQNIADVTGTDYV